jgi:hypothetical protein
MGADLQRHRDHAYRPYRKPQGQSQARFVNDRLEPSRPGRLTSHREHWIVESRHVLFDGGDPCRTFQSCFAHFRNSTGQ